MKIVDPLMLCDINICTVGLFKKILIYQILSRTNRKLFYFVL